MPLGTLDRTPPPFFKQGPSALSKLVVFSAVALFLMVADLRFKRHPAGARGMATALYPVQWLVLQPVELAAPRAAISQSLHRAQQSELDALRSGWPTRPCAPASSNRSRPRTSACANCCPCAARRHRRHRRPGALRRGRPLFPQCGDRPWPDPWRAGRRAGDGRHGVLGQVTRVYPLLSEVRLLIDRDLAIPVLNVRSGVRSLAYGTPGRAKGSRCATRWQAPTSSRRPADHQWGGHRVPAGPAGGPGDRGGATRTDRRSCGCGPRRWRASTARCTCWC
jgi:rod shape-determining protein MreC